MGAEEGVREATSALSTSFRAPRSANPESRGCFARFRVRCFASPRNDDKEMHAMTTPIDPLVSTEWLAAHLNDANVKILDATFKLPGVLPLPKDDYLGAHLPGAVFFDVDAVSDHSNPLPHMFPSAGQFGGDVGNLGISNADTVVIYDAGGWVAAPRAWGMFLACGHGHVRLL